MSSARSRKFRDDFNDRLDRAREAKNPRIKNSIYGEYPQQQPLRTSGAIGSWKGFANEQEKNEHMQKMMGFFNPRTLGQPIVRQWNVDPFPAFDGMENYNDVRGDGNYAAQVLNGQIEVPRMERNEAPQWGVNFTPDPTVRFETPVAPKEPDICEIINLDD